MEVSGSSRPWAAVRKAEFSILRRLGFRACTPTAFDLLDRLLSDLFPSLALRLAGNPSAGSAPMPSAGTDPASWDPESKLRCSNLARFLLEMCVVYDPEALYDSGRPPLVSAVAALLLSLLSHSAPRHYAQMLAEAVHLTELLGIRSSVLCRGESLWPMMNQQRSNRTTLMEIAEAMRSRWVMVCPARFVELAVYSRADSRLLAWHILALDLPRVEGVAKRTYRLLCPATHQPTL